MTKLAPEWVRTSDPVIRSQARYRWTTAPAVQFNKKSFITCESINVLSYNIVIYICERSLY